MKQIITISLFFLFSSQGFSTNQVKDYLILDNDTLYLYDSPLEQIKNISNDIFDLEQPEVLSSACWRGFYAEWRIINNTLYLSKVFDCHTHKVINKTIEKILKRKFTKGLLKADWVNSPLWCGKDLVGEKTLYFSVYRYERRLLMENGEVVDKKEYNYIPCDYEDENRLLNFVLKSIDWKEFPTGSYLSFEAQLKITNSGKIEDINILRSNIPSFNYEIIKGLEALPCWPVYYSEGRICNPVDWIRIEVKYDEIKEYVQ
jgi:hypothetical protein